MRRTGRCGKQRNPFGRTDRGVGGRGSLGGGSRLQQPPYHLPVDYRAVAISSGSSTRTRRTLPCGRSTSLPSVAAIVPPPPMTAPRTAPFTPPSTAPMIAPTPAPAPARVASPRMPLPSMASVTVPRNGYERPLTVTWSKLTVSRDVRLVRVPGSTAVTTPRITEPAGITTRPLTFRSTSVVASNRSSTCAVPELRAFCRRTSISVPGGTVYAPLPVAPVPRVPACVRPPTPDWLELPGIE